MTLFTSICMIGLLLSTAKPAISAEQWPVGVRLVNAGQQPIQVRALGLQHSGPAVILISGPNQHWHSDSGWFALLQPVLATKYRTYAVDRLGQGVSAETDQPSYRRFATDLALLLQNLNETQVVLLSFASGSISSLLLAHQQPKLDIKGLVLVDPDIPLTASVALYKGYPASWYQANLTELLALLQQGKWTERTAKKLEQERALVQRLLPPDYQHLMDWAYFDFMAKQRLRIERQQARAREIAAYAADLDRYQALPIYDNQPVSVINSDFEQQQIRENPQQKLELLAWQREGDQWSQLQARRSGGQYIRLEHSDHLVLFQRPDAVIKAIDWLMQADKNK